MLQSASGVVDSSSIRSMDREDLVDFVIDDCNDKSILNIQLVKLILQKLERFRDLEVGSGRLGSNNPIIERINFAIDRSRKWLN